MKNTPKDSHRLVTLHIKDLYVNIPIHEALQNIRVQQHKHNDKNFTEQICTLLEAILNQDYFTNQTHIYRPTKGVDMGCTISGIIAEIYIQSLERTHIKPLIDTKRINFYTRYTDDILIIYDTAHINLCTTTHHANTINNNLALYPTSEQYNRVSFLELTNIRNTLHLEINILRKPTTKDTTISYLSNHPLEQKLAAYRFLIDRMFKPTLQKNRLENEWKTILHKAKTITSPPP